MSLVEVFCAVVTESPANNTLEEIVEQEESTASVVVSGTVCDAQGDDSSLNLSADVSLDQGYYYGFAFF